MTVVCVNMAGALQTVVVGINGVVVDMQRRPHHHRQVDGQQQGCYMSQRAVLHILFFLIYHFSILPLALRVLGEPALLHTLALLEELENRPKAGEGHHAEDGGE